MRNGRRLRRRLPILLAAGMGAVMIMPATAVDQAETASYLRSSNGGASFQPMQLDDRHLGVNIVHAQASRGGVHVAYSDRVGGSLGPQHIYYRRSGDGGRSFDDSIQLDDDRGASTESDLAVVDAAVHVVWEEQREGEDLEDIFYTRSPDGGDSFESPVNLTDTMEPGAPIEEHDPVVAADGKLVAVAWEGDDDDGETCVEVEGEEECEDRPEDTVLFTDADDIFVAVSDDGGKSFDVLPDALNLTAPKGFPATSDANIDDEPGVAVSGDTIVVVFRKRLPPPAGESRPSDKGHTWWVRSTDGGASWSEPAPLPGMEGSNTPAVHMDGRRVHVVACHEDDTGGSGDEAGRVLYWRSVDGGASFDDPVVLDQGEGCNKAAVDGVGDDVHIVYVLEAADQNDVFYTASADGGESFEPARNLSANPESSNDPSVSVDPDDRNGVYITWTDSTDFLFSLTYGQKLPLTDGDERRFANEDVMRFTGGAFEMVLDGSDVGLGPFRIDALAELPPDEVPVLGDVPLPRLVLSFTESGEVPGLGRVEHSDLVLFTPDRMGEDTAGSFSMFLDGSDIGLTGSDEDIDAVEIDGDHLYLSTHGSFRLSEGLEGRAEDLFVCRDFEPGNDSVCNGPELVFEGSARGMNSSAENIDGFAFSAADPGEAGNAPGERAYFSTAENFHLRAIEGSRADMFACVIPEEDGDVEGSSDGTLADDCGLDSAPFAITFMAAAHGIHENLMAFDFPFREADEP